MEEQKIIQIFDEILGHQSDWSKFYNKILQEQLLSSGISYWEIKPDKKPMNKKFAAILLVSLPFLCLFGFLLHWTMELLP